MKIKKNGKTINLTESDIKKLKNTLLTERVIVDQGKTPDYFKNSPKGTIEMVKSQTSPKLISVNGDIVGMETPDKYCNKVIDSGEYQKSNAYAIFKMGGTLEWQNEPEEKQMYLSCIDSVKNISVFKDIWSASGADFGRAFRSGNTGIFNYIYKDGKIYITPAEGNEGAAACAEGGCMYIPKGTNEHNIRIKKNGKVINLTEAEIKKISKIILKEQNPNEGDGGKAELIKVLTQKINNMKTNDKFTATGVAQTIYNNCAHFLNKTDLFSDQNKFGAPSKTKVPFAPNE